MADGYITIGTKLDTSGLDKGIKDLQGSSGYVQYDTKAIEDFVNSYETASQKAQRLKEETAQAEKEVKELARQQKQVAKETAKASDNSSNLSTNFKSVGSSIQGAIGKVAKLALGVFALRSAYMAVRRASSDLASYDSQYATNLEYIRFVLTQAIAPVLQWIVNTTAKLLQYINMIINTLFGINLFSKGSAENFNKMKASAGGVSKAVKEIKKQLLGFDEINMLTDQSDTGTSAGGGGVGTPSFDLSDLQAEPPKWLQWLTDHKDEILAVLSGISIFLIAIKKGIKGIKALGLGIFIGGIVYAIESLIKYLQDPSWENFGKIIQGIGIAIIGLGVIIGNLPIAVIGAVTLIVGIIVKHWEQIKSFLQNGIDWLISKTDWVRENFGIVGELIYKTIVNTLQLILNMFDSVFKMIKGIFDGFIKFFKGVFTGDINLAVEGLKQIFVSLGEGIKNIFRNAWNYVLSLMQNGGKIFLGIKDGIVNAFTTIVNAIIKGINKVISIPFNAINDVLNKIKGVDILGVKPFDWLWGWNPISVPQIPTLKTGGIINMPNKGTMIGGMAIGGEAGREGVVPLTDQQAMAELGREIGKNVLVNLTNITSMNGRVISRELKNIQSEADFAYNQ